MEKVVVIKNEKGFHIRPVGEFVKKANEFKSKVYIECKGRRVNARSVMALMSLGVKKDSEISIIVEDEGTDAADALKVLSELIESGFGEL